VITPTHTFDNILELHLQPIYRN